MRNYSSDDTPVNCRSLLKTPSFVGRPQVARLQIPHQATNQTRRQTSTSKSFPMRPRTDLGKKRLSKPTAPRIGSQMQIPKPASGSRIKQESKIWFLFGVNGNRTRRHNPVVGVFAPKRKISTANFVIPNEEHSITLPRSRRCSAGQKLSAAGQQGR